MKRLIVVVMLVLSACALKPERVVDMGVDFSRTLNQGIKFTTASPVSHLAAKTISVWYQQDTGDFNVDSQFLVNFAYPNLTYDGWYIAANWNGPSGQDIVFAQSYTTSDGIWKTANDVFANGTINNIVVTYSMGTGNDPLIYINGTSLGLTENTTPSGSTPASTTDKLYIGGQETGSFLYSPDGKIYDVKVYNRVLTPGEVLDLYNSRCKIINDKGLVFHATFDGAAGLKQFDGATLGSANVFTDRIGGAIGVPSGNPIGYADDKLAVCGGQ
jgi:hypothetical protein